MNKKLIISFVLSSALGASFAHAMSLLPRARQVAAMVMNPSVRSAVTQANRTVTNTARNASRTVPETAQSVRQPMTRSFTTQAPRTVQTAQQSRARLAAGVGLAGAIGGAVYAEGEETKKASAPLQDSITTTDRDIVEKLLKMIEDDPDYARQFAQLVTAQNIADIHTELLYKIVRAYPDAKQAFIAYLTSDDAALKKFYEVESRSDNFTFYLYRKDLVDILIADNPRLIALFTDLVVKDFTTYVYTYSGFGLITLMMKRNPASISTFTDLVVKDFTTYVGMYSGSELIKFMMESNPASVSTFTDLIVKEFTKCADTYQGVQVIKFMMERDPALVSTFTDLVVKDFATYVDTFSGSELITLMMERNPALVSTFTDLVVKDFATYATSSGFTVIKLLMERNPASISTFTDLIVKNFAKYAHTYWASDLIELMMKYNPASVFTEVIINNFSTLANSGTSVLQALIDNNPQSKPLLRDATIDNFEALTKSYDGIVFIKTMIKDNPESLALFRDAVIKHYGALYDTWSGSQLVQEMIEQDETAFKQAVANNIPVIIESNYGYQYLKDNMKKDPNYVALVKNCMVRDCIRISEKEDGVHLLMSIMEKDPAVKQRVQERFKEAKDLEATDASKSLGVFTTIFRKAMRSETDFTPTELALFYSNYKLAKEVKRELGDAAIKQVVKEVIAIEKEYQKTHYTFVHGRNFAYNLREMVYRNLWEYAHNTKVPADFRFTHTKQEHDPLTKKTLIMSEEKKLHERNITVRVNYRSEELRNRRLFLNTNLFGNLDVGGSSSFDYFKRNSNASGWIRVSIADIFEQFGQKELYEKYKDRFEALDREHRALTKYGELLVVAVPKERVSEDVQTMDVHGSSVWTKTLDVLQKRETDPSFGDNHLNFTLAMTDTAALDPKSGIKVRSVHAVDPAKYAEWQAKYDTLMGEIETEFKRNWNRSINAKGMGHKELLGTIKEVQKAEQEDYEKNGWKFKWTTAGILAFIAGSFWNAS